MITGITIKIVCLLEIGSTFTHNPAQIKITLAKGKLSWSEPKNTERRLIGPLLIS